MRRREFITMLGGAAAAWPVAARAQQPAMPVIGFLNIGSSDTFAHLAQAFRTGLRDSGYVEGRNVAIEYRWAQGLYEHLPALAHDLVGRRVAVIAATGGQEVALAVKAETQSIPVVFTIGTDPVKAGLAASFNRPGANFTGATLISKELGGKQVELIRAMVPKASMIAVFTYTSGAPGAYTEDIRNAAQAQGQGVVVVGINGKEDIDRAFRTVIELHAGALVVDSDAFFNNLRGELVLLAANHKIPTIYAWREIAAVGGLMSYGPSLADVYPQAGIYAGQILKGAKPGDLPVVQPTKFELLINLKTARTLGLEVPPTLLAIADEVIE
jgi:putative tryptophan/tyrosine transport system substrate-binding protein